ncbi:hypothetical protein GGX14DRAFT_570825 [Mycena pura]|uniref:Uncharacterized protein n=1 Tax=Mycena pura TaxID=153505 RepID=A0AAD6V899_9AGAR|nr:hypothetical protein GGX14DRAFT_570825 [Mycena pura]
MAGLSLETVPYDAGEPREKPYAADADGAAADIGAESEPLSESLSESKGYIMLMDREPILRSALETFHDRAVMWPYYQAASNSVAKGATTDATAPRAARRSPPFVFEFAELGFFELEADTVTPLTLSPFFVQNSTNATEIRLNSVVNGPDPAELVSAGVTLDLATIEAERARLAQRLKLPDRVLRAARIIPSFAEKRRKPEHRALVLDTKAAFLRAGAEAPAEMAGLSFETVYDAGKPREKPYAADSTLGHGLT